MCLIFFNCPSYVLTTLRLGTLKSGTDKHRCTQDNLGAPLFVSPAPDSTLERSESTNLYTLEPQWVNRSHLDMLQIRPGSNAFLMIFETSFATTLSGQP